MNKKVNGLMKQRRIARERCKEKDKEIESLKNIIDELEKECKECKQCNIYDRLKELKEGGNNE